MLTSDFGKVIQHSYIVPNIEDVVPRWATLGVGPFFLGPPASIEEYYYRGEKCDCSLRVALGFWGDIEVELLEPVGNDKTFYSDTLSKAPGQLNHFASIVGDVDALISEHGLQGQVVQHGTASGVRFAYVEDLLPGGLLLEIFEETPLVATSFQAILEESRKWDGTRPLRKSEELAPYFQIAGNAADESARDS